MFFFPFTGDSDYSYEYEFVTTTEDYSEYTDYTFEYEPDSMLSYDKPNK